MAPLRARMMNGPGNRKHFAPLFRRQPCGDQRTAGHAGLHHQHTEGQATDDAVAAGKVAGTGAGIQRELGNHRTARGYHRVCQPPVALWIKIFQAGAEHADGMPANIQCRLMCGGIDTQRQATGDDKTGAGQTARERSGGVHARSRSAAATDHRQLRFFQDAGVSGHEQQRRGIADFCQQRRVIRPVPHQQMLARTL
ncbi:hypothetical protein D3C73_887480 [compost metagenome]